MVHIKYKAEGEKMKKFLQSNETRYRLFRTIIQGIIGVLIANADFLISGLNFSPEAKAFIVALVMAILSPIMSELGNGETDDGNGEAAEEVNMFDCLEGGENDENENYAAEE